MARHDPAAIVKNIGARAPLLHIKDGPVIWNEALLTDNPDPMVVVGKGAEDFPTIAKAAGGNSKWMIVEMDKTATGVFVALQESYDYHIKNKLAIGGNNFLNLYLIGKARKFNSTPIISFSLFNHSDGT